MSLSQSNSLPTNCHAVPSSAIDWLYEVELFKGLKPTALSLFFNEVEVQHYPARSIIFMPEHYSCEQLFVLREGLVDLYRLTADGKRLVTKRIQPGSVFGVMGLLGRTMQENFAESITDSIIYVITREHVLALLKRQPDFMLHMLEILGNRLCRLEQRLTEAVYSPVRVRIAHFLLTNADSASGVLTGVTHEEIANTVGAVRQTVTENLSLMRKQRLILTGLKTIRIVDREGLEQIIRGSDGQLYPLHRTAHQHRRGD